jgi:GxxExxY protein
MKRLRIPSTLPDDLEDLIHQTVGACIAVHEEVGSGLLDSCAQALAIELESRQIRFVNEHLLPVVYKGKTLGQYRIDILVDGRLVLELKAVEHVLPVHVA